MNQGKKANGWILCPSKSFPGKFYYFNVLNGECAWSLTEMECKTPRAGFNIHTVTDKSHGYPEPSSPPIEKSPTTSNSSSFVNKPIFSSLPRRVINNTQPHMFGQTTFPKYLPMRNIVWTPIEYPMYENSMLPQAPIMQQTPIMTPSQMLPQPPMFIANTPETRRQPFEHKVSNNHGFIVQSCNMPLSKRFHNYSKQSNSKNVFNKFYETSTPKGNREVMTNNRPFGSFENLNIEPKETKLKEPVFKMNCTQSGTRNKERSFGKSNSLESLLNSDYNAIQKSISKPTSRVDYAKQDVKDNIPSMSTKTAENTRTEENFGDLDQSDLRFLLLTKRRKSVDLEDVQNSSKGKKIKTSATDHPQTAKKCVTFELNVEDSKDSYGDGGDAQMISEHSEVDYYDHQYVSYVVSDIETLLDDLKCIEDFVQADDMRRLLIPHELRTEVESSCLGDGCGRQRVMRARQLARKITDPPEYYEILPSQESEKAEKCENYTLSCCLDAFNGGEDVILITNNRNLYNEVKSFGITCYTTQEIKDGAGVAKPEVSFEFKKIQMPVDDKNDRGQPESSNVFLQSKKQFEPSTRKQDNAVKTFRSETEEPVFQTKKSVKDANTSPIDCDALNNMDKQNRKFDIETANVESRLENLFIKDTKSTKDNTNFANDIPVAQPVVRFDNGLPRLEFDQMLKTKNKVTLKEIVNVYFNAINKKDIFSLDKILNEYFIQNGEIDEIVKLRMEEWICVFSQTMENALVNVLIRHVSITDRLSMPWVLYESIEKVQDLYGSHTDLKMATEKLMGLLVKYSIRNGKINPLIKPKEYMKILGWGRMLVQVLKCILPNNEELTDAETTLNGVLMNMTQPLEDETQVFQTPVLRRCDVEDTPRKAKRQNFVKRSSEIMEYLKAHYPQQKYIEAPPNHEFTAKKNEPKVLRTVGRNLNLLEIDNTKTITFKKTTEDLNAIAIPINVSNNRNIHTNDVDNKVKLHNTTNFKDSGNREQPIVVTRKFNFSGFKITRKVNKNAAESIENVATPIDIDDLNIPKHGNTFNQDSAGPKVIRTFGNVFLPKNNKNLNKADGFDTPNFDSTQNITNNGKSAQDMSKDENMFAQKLSNNENLFDQKVSTNTIKQKTLKDNKLQTAGPETVNVPKRDSCNVKDTKMKMDNVDLDALDYECIEENVSPDTRDDNEFLSENETVSFVYKINKITNHNIESNDNALDNHFDYNRNKDNGDAQINDAALVNDNNAALNNDNGYASALNNDNGYALNDDSVLNHVSSALDNDSSDKVLEVNENTSDSGFDNDSDMAYTFAKNFLSELSGSYTAVYQFLDKSIAEFREEDMQEDNRRLLRNKANTIHLLIAEIISNLKSIIERESDGVSALKEMLIKSGLQASADKRMTRYRQVVMKCLEQALMLETVLRGMLSVADDDLDALASVSAATDNKYLNIFE